MNQMNLKKVDVFFNAENYEEILVDFNEIERREFEKTMDIAREIYANNFADGSWKKTVAKMFARKEFQVYGFFTFTYTPAGCRISR